MDHVRDFKFERCTSMSGIDFENWVTKLMNNLGFAANRVGKNDGGIDIVATDTHFGMAYNILHSVQVLQQAFRQGSCAGDFCGSDLFR